MFTRIAYNEIRLFFRDRKAVLLTFLMPMALIFLFALIFGGTGKKSDMGTIQIGICDLDKSDQSKKLVASLDSNASFALEKFTDTLALRESVFKGDLSTGLVILPKQDENATDKRAPFLLFTDKTRKVEASIVQPLLTAELMRSNGETLFKPMIMQRIRDKWPDMDNATFDEVGETMTDFSGGDFMDRDRMQSDLFLIRAFEPTSGVNPGLVQAFAGTAVMTLLFAMAGMGMAITEEKERGTLRKLLMSPVKAFDFLTGKLISALVISTLQLMLLAMFTMLMFGLPVMDHLPEVVLLIACTAFACSAFGIFLASISSSRKQIESMSTLVVMLMSLIGGSMVPIFFMPVWMQKLSSVTINYWSNMGFFDIFLRDTGWGTILFRCSILILYGAILLAMGVFFSRKKLFKV